MRTMQKGDSFSEKLLYWHKHYNKRQMPWKGEKNPYKIWLSEVILQQTRVEQGWSYYEKFIFNFPSICDLANADDKSVFKLWEGLGYYNRCKNLLHTARFICNNLQGKFPDKYEDVLALKGVGNYTASAICSFAYNMPYAVVDGNVFRVLSRIYGIDTAIDSVAGKNIFSVLAQENLDEKNPALYNQAIMDFGATVCKPANPQCATCFMNDTCNAHITARVNILPVKEKILQKKLRRFTWLVLQVNDKVLIRLRNGNDIWQNLYEFYLYETDAQPQWTEENINDFCYNQFSEMPITSDISGTYVQQLTHQTVKAVFVQIHLSKIPKSLKNALWIKKNMLTDFAFPKVINDYCSDYLN